MPQNIPMKGTSSGGDYSVLDGLAAAFVLAAGIWLIYSGTLDHLAKSIRIWLFGSF